MNQTLLDLEKQLGIGPTFVARLLGIAYPTYAAYRNGQRELPIYHKRQSEWIVLCHLLVAEQDQAQRQKSFQEFVHAKSHRS